MRVGGQIAHLCSRGTLLLPVSSSARLSRELSNSAASWENCRLTTECDEFLPWLRQKAGVEISSVLSIGSSSYGRSLFASKPIQAGECILKVPYNAQITADKVSFDIEPFLAHDIGKISRLAAVLLAEQKLGQDSGWATYISSLPPMDEMHNTIFWSKDELEMIWQSPVYQEIIDQKAHIAREFSALRPMDLAASPVGKEAYRTTGSKGGTDHLGMSAIHPFGSASCLALKQFPEVFGDVLLEDFMHAYSLVSSRAWETSKGASLIPFADFLNHDGTSDAVLLSDENKEISEVIADRNYAVGEQVMIRYGKLSNATLMLDFGFTLPYNIYDQVQLWMDVPSNDPLCAMKSEMLREHSLPKITNADGFNPSWNFFIIKEVKSARGKGKGIPQALRAFARVLVVPSVEELKDLATEAAENDGRLARLSLKNREREIQAHRILLSRLIHMIQGHDASLKVVGSLNTNVTSQFHFRRKTAQDLLNGELRVLQSACAWLMDYCASL